METTIEHGNISLITAHTFEIIPKGQYTQKIIQNFEHLEKIPSSNFTTTYHVGIHDFSLKLNRWKIKYVQESIEELEKNNTNIILNHTFDILKKAVTGIEVSIWEPEFLPFNYIVLSIHLDKEKLDLGETYQKLSLLLRSFADYWKTFDGMICYDDKTKFNFPVYYQIFYDHTSIKPKLNKIMKNLQKYSQDKLNIKKYLENSNKLKDFFLLKNLDNHHNLISLLKIQNDFFMIGNIGQYETDFATVFSLEPKKYTYTGSNPFFPIGFSWPFPVLFLPYVLLVTPIFWMDFNRKKLMKILTDVNRFKVKYKTDDYLKDNWEKALAELVEIENDLNFLLSELNELKTVNRIFNSYFITNPEIIDKSVVITKSYNVKEQLIKNKINSSYLISCNLSFRDYNSEIEKNVKFLQGDLSFIKKRIEFLQNKLDYKIKSKQNKILIIGAIVTGIFATLVGIDVILDWVYSPTVPVKDFVDTP